MPGPSGGGPGPQPISSGGGSPTLETPTGEINEVNEDFVFVGTPIAVFRNGVLLSPNAYTLTGTTVTLDEAPPSGEITGLTQ